MAVTIMCSAIWVDDGKPYAHQPMDTGIVFCGFRHHNIIEQMTRAFGPRKHYPELGITFTQGFLTSDNNFVNREIAHQLAQFNGQLDSEHRNYNSKYLYSEDLW